MKIQTSPCLVCSIPSVVEVDTTEYQRYLEGQYVQVAFSQTSAEDRELIMTGTHPECWKTLGAEDD